MGLSTARLYRRAESGVYFIRILLLYPGSASFDGEHTKTVRNKAEVRRSLRTANPKLASKIAAVLNAALAQVPMSARHHVFEDLFAKVMERFGSSDNQSLRIDDRDDMQNFLGFFYDLNQVGLEDFKGAFTQRIAQRGVFTQAPAFTIRDQEDRAVAVDLMKELARPEMADLKEALLTRLRGRPISIAGIDPAPSSSAPLAPPSPIHATPQTSPAMSMREPLLASTAISLPNATAGHRVQTSPQNVPNPLLWGNALVLFKKAMKARQKGNAKTIAERVTVLGQLHDFMLEHHGFKRDFQVHEVQSFQVASFLDDSANRLARGVTKKQKEEAGGGDTLPTVAAATLLKRITAVEVFFNWAYKEAGAAFTNAAAGQEDRREALNKLKAAQGESYEPFTATHLQTIFEPTRFLVECRDADHFWGPLLGCHMGARLGEFINAELSQIKQHELSGNWYLDVKDEDAKNENSVRRIPITKPLLDLGFLDYVNKLKQLGATHLFPHRDMNTPTALKQPSKNLSEKFARYLDVCGISDPALVFHSFRHTLVNTLMHVGVPLTIIQQLVGHMAQDVAIRQGLITEEQARSVTLTVYTHQDIPGMNAPDQFDVLKTALETNYKLPLDYRKLKIAADIVLKHVRKDRKSKTGFDCGWPPQNRKYTGLMKDELNALRK
ncbi:site-specific integrase [Xylophilus sp. GOD-11R]|uniref:site-specific integrase n=1 Tax=Xylophilus sp. GOD-11R TaxID=3089814 RepID=UPI00298C89B2|nr:site-specific integrase [Xylophilus sp. GOD-11R]WPB57382.1 site-specific integrase [Xylophilus sp. GOD-11R]